MALTFEEGRDTYTTRSEIRHHGHGLHRAGDIIITLTHRCWSTKESITLEKTKKRKTYFYQRFSQPRDFPSGERSE